MNNNSSNIPLSVLDLAVVSDGKTVGETYDNSVDLARKVESMGFTRYWFAEHHNMATVASSATSLLIGHIAGKTSTIRVGSGGIMLPNHAPLVIAEQFGTLASMYPNRIDLGLGRAPGTDQITAQALRRDPQQGMNFPENIQELRTYLSEENRDSRVRAIPGEGLDIPVWILGSSTDSARLAGALGLPYAFASHFAPNDLHRALELYRQYFRPSEQLQEPYVIACVNVTGADTDEEAERLSTSLKRMFLGIITGKRIPLQPPIDSMNGVWHPTERAAVQQMLTYSFVGGPEKLKHDIGAFLDATGVNELMAVGHIYDHGARVHSYEVLKQALHS
jgi:luciferase family oxidoreductase group 1